MNEIVADDDTGCGSLGRAMLDAAIARAERAEQRCVELDAEVRELRALLDREAAA